MRSVTTVARPLPPPPPPSSAHHLMTSKVLFFDRLPSHWTERDLTQALAPVEIVKSVIMRKRNALFTSFSPTTLEITKNAANQALVEVADVDTAVRVVKALEAKPLIVAQQEDSSNSSSMAITASYSKNQELHERQLPTTRGRHHHHRGRHNDADAEKANRILLVTVQNPTYPVTTDLVHSIFKGFGAVEKVVIFIKPIGLQVREYISY